MADATDLKSVARKGVWVRLPLSIPITCEGGMAEWSNAAVLKTAGSNGSEGSNPSSSANF